MVEDTPVHNPTTTRCSDFPCDYACLRRNACDHEERARKMFVSKTETHSDDLAVDQFAVAMKEKLAIARAKGRGGWQECPESHLVEMLREHVAKGDMRDVANIAMMIYLNRET